MIRCEQCFEETGKEIYFDKITYAHLRFTHDGMTNSEYELKFPEAPMEDEEVTSQRAESTSRSNKGREFTEEHKAALSRGSSGKVLSEDHKKHIGESGEGRVFTDEHRENLSDSVNEFWASEEGLKRKKEMSENSKGRVFTDEHRQHISEAKEGISLSEYHKEAIGEGQLGLVREFSDEHRELLSKAKSGVPLSKEHKESLKAFWNSEEGKLISAERLKGREVSDFNSKEQYFDSFLQEYFPGFWRFTGNGQFYIGSMCPDFIATDGSKKVIEYFGTPWHDTTHEPKRVKDLEKHGYETLVIWSWQLDNADKSPKELDKLLKRIAKVTGYTPKELL
jgi:hypothetical protein